MPARRFEQIEGTSSKFWEVDVDGKSLTVRFGRIGTNGQTQTKAFATDAKASAERDKLVKEKLGKGYKEVAPPAALPAVAPKAAPVSPPLPPPPPPSATKEATPPATTATIATTAAPIESVSAAAAAPGPVADAPMGSPSSRRVAWTDDLRRSMEAVRGVSLAPQTEDANAIWKKLRKRASDLEDRWQQVLADADHGPLFQRAFARLREEVPAAPSDADLEGAILAVADYAGDWTVPSHIAEAVDRLVLEAGAPFAMRATLATLARWVVPGAAAKIDRRKNLSAWGYRRHALSPFDRVRAHVATSDEATYAACVEVARSAYGEATDDLTRVAIAYMCPHVDGWAEDLLARVPEAAAPLLTSTKDEALVGRTVDTLTGYRTLVDASERGAANRAAAILANLGPTPFAIDLSFRLYDKLPGSEYQRGCASVLGLVDAPEAIAGLLARAEQKEAQPALQASLARRPDLAVRALADAAVSRSKLADVARQLLTTTVRAGVPDLDGVVASLPDTQRKVVEAARGAATSTSPANVNDVPEALRAPRWLARKKRVEAIVEIAPPPHDDAFAWPKGAREALPRDLFAEGAGHRGRDAITTILGWLDLPSALKGETNEEVIAKACTSTVGRRQWGSNPVGLGVLPEVLARAILKHTPTGRWGRRHGLSGFGAAVVRFEMEIVDDVIRLAADLPFPCLELLLPYDVARAAPVVAHAYAELKKARAVAERWLRIHPRAAIAGLLPAAIGKPGKARSHAEAALHFLVGEGHRDAIFDVAGKAGARDAVLSVLESDPFDRLPAKLPTIPEFAQASRLSPPILDAAHGGGALPPETVANLLTMLAFSRIDEPYAGVGVAKSTCTPASLAAFAWDLFSAWLLSGASSKEQWAMTALAHLGDDDCARRLAAKVREWPGESAHARAVIGLDVLAAMGTDVALMHLYGISQKLKFKGLQEKAGEKITLLAEARGLTEDELGDRLVPDLNLDDDGTMTLDFGSRQFRVTFDESLKPYVLDGANKRLPDLPKAGKADDAEKAKDATERWKALKKDAKTIASQQVLRFELAMCARRRWSAPVFQQFLAGHPVVRHVVRRLVWAAYAEDGRPQTLFRLAEDGTFADARDEVFTLPVSASIGIVHALEIDSKDAGAMGQVFADYEILQPFVQLGRDTHALTEAEKTSGTLTRTKGRTVPTGKVLGLESRGWRRGEPQDGGGIWWIEKPLPDGLEARLALDPGMIVGMLGEHPEQKLGDLVLHEEGVWTASSRTYGALDAIVASELLRDLESL